MATNKYGHRHGSNSKKTADRILKAAEELFANQGFFRVTLRDIAEFSQAHNAAAVHYHFGSKENLFLEVLNRHIIPIINQFIHEIKCISQTRKLCVDDIVYSYLVVMKEEISRNETSTILFSRLLTRLMLDEYKVFRRNLLDLYKDTVNEFFQIIQPAFPKLSEEALHWRIHIAMSTLFHVFAGNDVLRTIMPTHIVHLSDPQKIEQYIVPFVIAGLKA